MKSGLLLKIQILVPYDPADLDSITSAAADAKKLCTVEGLGGLLPGAELVSATSEPHRSRDKPVVKPAAPVNKD